MKFSTLAVATLAVTALAGGTVFAQDAAPMAAGPAVTMQPVPNPPEMAKPMGHMHHNKHMHHHMRHMMKKAAKAEAAEAPAPAPAQ